MSDGKHIDDVDARWRAEDAPASDEMLARLAPMSDRTKDAFRRARGPQKAATKQLVSLRLDRDLIDHFRAGGEGWQSRINAALRKVSGL